MDTPSHVGSGHKGFTLVEMLVVIVIIGILASFILIAGRGAVVAGYITDIKVEITQLETACENFRTKYGEYPPDFTSTADLRRFLRKAFPRYDYSATGDPVDQLQADLLANYNINIDPTTGGTTLDPASALAFWLGGLPEQYDPNNPNRYSQRPAGFHSDPAHPFRQGGPRTEPFYGFDYQDEALEDNRFVLGDTTVGWMRYYPKRVEQAPFVYFKARRDRDTTRYEYGYVNTNNRFVSLGFPATGNNVARPYLVCDPANTSSLADPTLTATVRKWRNPEKFQIICAGLSDGLFSDPDDEPFRYTRAGHLFTDGDLDNITNFSDDVLEKEL